MSLVHAQFLKTSIMRLQIVIVELILGCAVLLLKEHIWTSLHQNKDHSWKSNTIER